MTDFNLSLGRKGKSGEFDSSDIKEGTKKTDLENKISQNIFDALDKDKDGTLNGIEVEKFLAQLKDAAKNDNLSKREAKKLLKLEGVKGVKADKLFEFLKEIAAIEVEDDYSAYDDGMGVDIKNPPKDEDEVDVVQTDIAEDEEPIDNTKAYYENGRVMTLGDDGKTIFVQENENSEPVKLQVDEEGNVISYAKNGESFKMTAKRLGLPTEGEQFEKFKELNEKAAKKGFFHVGGKVIVPSETIENLALDKVNVYPDNEIAAYNKFMARKQEAKEHSEQKEKTPELTDEEMRKKYPGIAKPDENTKYESPKWEVPEAFIPPVQGDKKDETKPDGDKPVPEPAKPQENTSDKTNTGSPKTLNVTRKDFTAESLKKRYPDKDYKEIKEGDTTRFVNKKTGQTAFSMTNLEDGQNVGILYKDGKRSVALEFSKNGNYKRTQFDENEKASFSAFYYDYGKLEHENIINSDGTVIKSIYYNENGNKIEENDYRSGKSEDFEIKKYYDDGTLLYTYDGLTKKYDCPDAKDLKAFIYSKNSLGLPISKNTEIKETVLKKVTADNVTALLEAYKDSTGVDLLQDISDEWAISSSEMKEIKDHINKCLNEKYDIPNDFDNISSQVKNEYHTGPEFSVKKQNDIITVKNKSTGKEHSIDLEKILANVSTDKKARLKNLIQELPGEVLEDLSIEVSKIFEAEEDGAIMGFYDPGADLIPISNILINGSDSISMVNEDEETLVHEIGHAVDFNGYLSNTSTIGNNKDFVKINSEEMKKYIEAGNKRYNDDDKSTQTSSNYCTTNDLEMFAECYTLLMTGNNNSKECILKYFPETLKVVEQHINETRKLAESKRH